MSVSTAATTIKYPVISKHEGHLASGARTVSYPPFTLSPVFSMLWHNDWLATIVESGEILRMTLAPSRYKYVSIVILVNC